MAQFLVRAPGPTDTVRAVRAGGPLIAFLLIGCVSYEPAPIDASQVLEDLEALRWQSPSPGAETESEGVTPRQLASYAITHNPSLAAVRTQIGVNQALLVEAGLLVDPVLGWDAMNIVAEQIDEGTGSSQNFIAGLGLMFELPRPGELDAKKGAARWRIEEARQQVTQVEWRLAQEVHVSSEDVLEALRLLEQIHQLESVAETTHDYFKRARDAGAATAIQANLALGDLLAIRARLVPLEAQLRAARHRLNALLGLPPSAVIPVVPAPAAADESPDTERVPPETLVERSLSVRPDLIVLLASYQAAEEDVRLEVKRQFPLIAIGTAIAIQPGFFTDFNRPAIKTAIARRDTLRATVEAQVHEVRREIQDAYASLGETRRQLRFLETELLPNTEESLRLTGEAFEAGEVTLFEILTLQRTLVDARTRTTETRAELQRRHWLLLAASGTLLTDPDAEDNDDEETPVRQ